MDRKKSLILVQIVVLATLFIFTSIIFAQNKFLLNIDTGLFEDSKNQTYLEINYSLPQAAVKHVETEQDGFNYELIANLQIFQKDSLWVSKLWKLKQTNIDSSQINTTEIIDVLRYPIENSAYYKIILKIRDLNMPDNSDSVEVALDLEVLPKEEIGLSDLVLATNIQKANEQSPDKFKKYTYEVIPNPGKIYGDKASNLFYYYEIYNLMKNIPGKKYKIMTMIKEFNGSIVDNLTIPYRTKMKKFDRGIEFGKIDISKLLTGKYTLIYGICDSAQTLIFNKQKDFYVYNSAIDIVPLARGNQQQVQRGIELFKTMSDAELDAEFDKMFYLTTKSQRNLYKNLTNIDAKYKIIYSTWQASVPFENVSWFRFRQDYLARVDIAADKYSDPFKPGWRTDQGRVFVLYGAPSNIERHTSDVSTKPYEVWQYDELEGGVFFVFVDRMGLNRYELVHSSLRGELQNPNWERLITTTIQSY